MTSSTLHDALRIRTRDDHISLENDVARCGFFESLSGYVGYLHRFGAFQHEAERRLAAADATRVVADWPDRRRSHLVRADLAALGATSRCSFPSSDVWVVSERPEHILGTLYVLEGATLGGAVLLKVVASLGVTATSGGSFLSGYGKARAAMWRSFLETLAAWDARGLHQEEVLRAAAATFRAAREYLLERTETTPAITPAWRGPLQSSL